MPGDPAKGEVGLPLENKVANQAWALEGGTDKHTGDSEQKEGLPLSQWGTKSLSLALTRRVGEVGVLVWG